MRETYYCLPVGRLCLSLLVDYLFICLTLIIFLILLLQVIGAAPTTLLTCYLCFGWPDFASNLGKLCVTWLRTSLINYLT